MMDGSRVSIRETEGEGGGGGRPTEGRRREERDGGVGAEMAGPTVRR